MLYTVIIDRSSTHMNIEATSAEEAKQKGYEHFEASPELQDDYTVWVGDVVEGADR